MTKKIVISILSFIVIGALVFCIVWGVNNYEVIKQAMDGTALYTKDDIDSAYQDGYDTALKDKQDYVTLIAQYRATIDELKNEKNSLTAEINQAKHDKSQLSEEVIELTLRLEDVNKRIIELETTIESYEAFIEEVEASDRLVATFMVDGAVYLVQQYVFGDTVSVDAPEDTEAYVFNGWTVDGEVVTIGTYAITESTTFIADLTYKEKYEIAFYANDVVVQNGTAYEGATLTAPETPTKENYDFNGWKDSSGQMYNVGENNVVLQYVVYQNETFTAVFTEYNVEGDIYLVSEYGGYFDGYDGYTYYAVNINDTTTTISYSNCKIVDVYYDSSYITVTHTSTTLTIKLKNSSVLKTRSEYAEISVIVSTE